MTVVNKICLVAYIAQTLRRRKDTQRDRPIRNVIIQRMSEHYEIQNIRHNECERFASNNLFLILLDQISSLINDRQIKNKINERSHKQITLTSNVQGNLLLYFLNWFLAFFCFSFKFTNNHKMLIKTTKIFNINNNKTHNLTHV